MDDNKKDELKEKIRKKFWRRDDNLGRLDGVSLGDGVTGGG